MKPSAWRLPLLVSLLLCTTAASAATFTVTNTNDSGAGSLRAALEAANSTGGADTIAFSIGSGHQVIRPLTALPRLVSVTIDGTTQPGYAGKPLIELDGSLCGGRATGLELDGSTVKALVVNRFPSYGIYGSNTNIFSCYIGTDQTGMVLQRNGDSTRMYNGIFRDNVIAGNSWNLYTFGTVTIRDNFFGVNATATAVFPGTSTNLYLTGGTATVVGNVFGGGTGIFWLETTGTIQANYFGRNATGTPLPSTAGVLVSSASDNYIFANRFANNSAYGVAVQGGGALRNKIVGNYFENNGIAIDLGLNGVSLNDGGDFDSGANNYTNFPVITRATSVSGVSTIAGTLDVLANTEYTIELFVSSSCNASGYGDGAKRLSTFAVTTDGSGHATFSQAVAALTPGHVVTATATSNLEGTSEFSQCHLVEGPGAFAFESPTVSAVEGGGAELVIKRLNGAVGTASVSFATANGTALAGSDYNATNGTLTFNDGETLKTVIVPIVNDATLEGPQAFTASLSNPTGGATLANAKVAAITITDDDPPPGLNISNPSVLEGNSGTTPMTFQLHLAAPAEVPITFQYSTSSWSATLGIDYLSTSGSITFAPGETQKSVAVQIVGDASYEHDEVLSLSVNSGSPYFIFRSASGTIRNDDAPPVISGQNVSIVEGTSGTNMAAITLQATAPVDAFFYYSTAPRSARSGEDYVSRIGTVSFNHETTKTIEIPIIGDTVTEDHEQFAIHLYHPFPVGVDYELQEEPIVVTILNDDYGVGPDKLLVPVGKTRSGFIDLGGAALTEQVFTITSSAPDAVSVPATVTIPAGQSRATFDMRALAPGRREDVTVTFPAALGGEAHAIRVWTYEEAVLTLAPAELTLYPGQTVTVHAALQPVNQEPVLVALDGTSTVSVAGSFILPPGGQGSFEVKALKNGPVVVTATLPAANGSEAFSIGGRVTDPPTVPTLHSISPVLGSIAGGTVVDLHGALLRSDCSVAFGGVPATMVQFLDASTIKTIAPPHDAGTVDVALRCGTDVATLANAFTYRGAGPHVSSIAPSAGTTAGGTYVRITGLDFLSSCWPYFGDAVAPSAVVRDANTIDAVAPPHLAGDVDVRLLCTGVDALLEDGFTFTTASDAAAQIATLEPPHGAPGEVVTIGGTGFRPDDVVSFDASAARVLDATPETLTVTVPDRAPGQVSVTIGRNATTLATTGPIFTVFESAPPRISRLAPATVAAGGELVLEGTGIRPSYAFALQGVALQTITSLPTRAVVRVPSDMAPGAYPLEIVNAGGQLASIGPAVNITAEGLVVLSVAARCGAVDGGIDVTIDGRGFAGGATVSFDNVPAANVTVVDATRIVARVPANYAGPATIAVTNPDGTTATLTDAFRYYSPFDPGAGCSTVRIRGVRK